MTRHMLIKGLSLVLLTGMISMPAGAMSASEAKSAGLIAEDCKGYVQAKKPEGQSVAYDINSKRRAEYDRLAAQQNLPAEVVAATAGAKLCGK